MPFPSHTQTSQGLPQAHTSSSESTQTHTAHSIGSSEHSGKPYSIVIDDLDALEMYAPDARTARIFMSKLIQSLAESRGSSGPGSTVASAVSSSSTGVAVTSLHAKEGAKGDICTIAAYGRQMLSHVNERSNYDRFFPSSLRVNSVSCGDDSFEPTLTEYCRYRCDLCVCVQALTSGYSSEVHGLFTIVHTHTARSSSSSNSSSSTSSSYTGLIGGGGVHRSNRGDHLSKARSAMSTQVLHYKALDSGVKCCLSTDLSLS